MNSPFNPKIPIIYDTSFIVNSFPSNLVNFYMKSQRHRKTNVCSGVSSQGFDFLGSQDK